MSGAEFRREEWESAKFAHRRDGYYAGVYEVVSKSLPYLWERLTAGGIMLFDQYNFDVAPGETRAVREFLPHAKVRTFPNGWMPNAYIVKE